MARLARIEIFAPDEIAIIHVMNRTVRRCFLLGNDPVTGKNYDHRKVWLDEELKRLAAQFGIDLLCQAILSNHFHLVLRSRPDVVAAWEDAEVARRWLMLCPLRKDEMGRPKEPSDPELNSIVNNSKRLAEIRSRLSDVSWWMRLLSQNIAQRANREDQEVGKFWQARYRAVRLLDEAAVLACAAYVDLNPIRAAMAETLEASDFTSVQKRIQAVCQQATSLADSRLSGNEKSVATRADQETGDSVKANERVATADVAPDAHLSRLPLDELNDSLGPCCHQGGSRASDKGFLPMSVAAYVDLLDWTARQIRSDKRGSTPDSLAPVFERLRISDEVWCGLVKDFGRLFYAVAGRPHSVDSHRSRDGRSRYKTKQQTRQLMGV
jgi:hypothetical protein